MKTEEIVCQGCGETRTWRGHECLTSCSCIEKKGSETDKYGNPIDGDRLIYCSFPDCGCDGARLCMAEKGA